MGLGPKISIVIPVYNGGNYLREAIDSALAQTYEQCEVLVVNDGSCDGGATEIIARSYRDRIRYFEKDNGGVASALNLGIREMRGDFLSWLSHDDVYYPHKIERQVQELARHSADSIFYSDFDLINSTSQIVGTVEVVRISTEQVRYYLTVSHPVHGCTTLIPRRCFDEVGMFDERLTTTQDYDLWHRLAEKFPFVLVPEKLIQSRHHAEQGTVVMNSLHVQECNDLLIRFLERMTKQEIMVGAGESLGLSYVLIARNFAARGFYKAASIALYKSLWYIHRQKISACAKSVCLATGIVIKLARVVLVGGR